MCRAALKSTYVLETVRYLFGVSCSIWQRPLRTLPCTDGNDRVELIPSTFNGTFRGDRGATTLNDREQVGKAELASSSS